MSGERPGPPAGDGASIEAPSVGDRTGGGRPLAIEPGALIGEAWGLFGKTWPACLVVYWGAFAAFWLIMNLLVVVLAGLNAAVGDPSFTPFLEFVRFLGLFLIPAWLWLGQGIGFLKIARREPVALEDLFRGGPYLLTTLLAFLVFLAVVAVPCLLIYGIAEGLLASVGGESMIAMARRILPAQTPEDIATVEGYLLVMAGLSTAILALSFASFFAVRARLRPFPFLIVDRNAGVLESLGTSMRLTKGRASTLVVVHLAQFTINVAGLMVCCAGLLVSLPLTRLISAVTYNALAANLPPVEAEDGCEGADETG